jgi:hypothetical protein
MITIKALTAGSGGSAMSAGYLRGLTVEGRVHFCQYVDLDFDYDMRCLMCF